MKVVFPCKGAIVLLKNDLNTLKAFYNTTILTSTLLDTYKNNDSIVQIKTFNYIPKNNSIILQNANLLTTDDIRKILSKSNFPNKSKRDEEDSSNITNEETSQISDDDILSNPFFQTLKPLN